MYEYKYPHPSVTTDCVIFGFDGVSLKVLLIERGIDPYKGSWAFPGGFLNMNESAEEGAARELEEETGLTDVYIEQLQAFSAVNRDPRERVITIAFYALVNISEVQAGDDAAKAQWFKLSEIPSLAFDHEHILRVAMSRLKERLHFEPVGFELLPDNFTLSELQNLYEAILEVKFDRRNFHRKMIELGLVEQADPNQVRISRKQPIIYRFNAGKYRELKQKRFRLEF